MSDTPVPVNHSVDVGKLFAIVADIKTRLSPPDFAFRAETDWTSEAHGETRIRRCYSAGGEDASLQRVGCSCCCAATAAAIGGTTR